MKKIIIIALVVMPILGFSQTEQSKTYINITVTKTTVKPNNEVIKTDTSELSGLIERAINEAEVNGESKTVVIVKEPFFIEEKEEDEN